MTVDVDKYAFLNSSVHSFDQRCKIVSFLILITAISFMSSAVPAIAGLLAALIVAVFSRLPVKFLIKRIAMPLFFLLPLFLLLPVTAGGDIYTVIYGINIYFQGIKTAVLILIKTSSIILLFNIMIATCPFSETVCALQSLRLPEKIINMIAFTYRFIHVYIIDFNKMRTALILRGYKSESGLRSWKTSANLTGSLIVRSYEQTDRIHNAMKLRGYSGRLYTDKEFRLTKSDIVKTSLIILTAASLIYLEFYSFVIISL